jgi:hypothetical protein
MALIQTSITKIGALPAFDLSVGDDNYWTERLSYELLKIHEDLVDIGYVIRQSDKDLEEHVYKGLIGEAGAEEYSFIELLQNTPLVIRIDRGEDYQDHTYESD